MFSDNERNPKGNAMKDVGADYLLAAFFLWIGYDNLTQPRNRFEFWMGVVVVVLTIGMFIRGTARWIRLRQGPTPPSAVSKSTKSLP